MHNETLCNSVVTAPTSLYSRDGSRWITLRGTLGPGLHPGCLLLHLAVSHTTVSGSNLVRVEDLQAVLGCLARETLEEGCSLVSRWFLALKWLREAQVSRWSLALKWSRAALEPQWWAQQCSLGVQEWLVACCRQALWA